MTLVNPAIKQEVGTCTSCGVRLVDQGAASFPCPECGETVGRCPRCRDQGVEYACKECGFLGP